MGTAERAVEPSTFRHEALFYAGDQDFVARAAAFVHEGVSRGEPVLVVVAHHKIGMLREALGAEARRVTFADMADVGANPARIIPAWRRFVEGRGARPARGIGEPIWAARTPDELIECQRHEALLNLAFAGAQDFDLLCPYDTTALPEDVVEEALRSHPYVHGGGTSSLYRGDDGLPDRPLAPPPDDAARLAYGGPGIEAVHEFVANVARALGLRPSRALDLSIAAHELAINSIRHADGGGEVRVWGEPGTVVCEVRDGGVIRDPLVGRAQPTMEQESGRGIWIVHQLCDLVHIRSSASGTTVRVRMALG